MRHRACTILIAASIVALAGSAMAIGVFTEDFSAPAFPPWVAAGDAGGHLGAIGGEYWMTSDWQLGSKLQRFDTGGSPLSSYTHSVDVALNPFFLTGGGGTKTDFKWKSFGPDGFMEVVVNSFGNVRLYHNDSDGGSGNVIVNFAITNGVTGAGIADGDTLGLAVDYDMGTDTINATYSLNGAAPISFYSGGGIDGPVGDLITNFVEVEMFKWNDDPTDQGYVAIDQWDLIPEPSMVALFGIGGLALMVSRRRK